MANVSSKGLDEPLLLFVLILYILVNSLFSDIKY